MVSIPKLAYGNVGERPVENDHDPEQEKVSDEQVTTTLTDHIRTEHRRQIMDRVLTGLIALNGGAAVALLAFLQKMLEENKPVAQVVLFGMIPLMIGLVSAIFFQLFRYFTSRADQKRKEASDDEIRKKWHKRYQCYRYSYLVSMYVAIVAFIVGVFVVICGTLVVIDFDVV